MTTNIFSYRRFKPSIGPFSLYRIETVFGNLLYAAASQAVFHNKNRFTRGRFLEYAVEDEN
jgi:hypothetical protein